jgi:hypothetical protein
VRNGVYKIKRIKGRMGMGIGKKKKWKTACKRDREERRKKIKKK